MLAHGGTVERFGSAGFAAYWNAPLADADHAMRAVGAATRMMGVVRGWNAMAGLRRTAMTAPPLELAIGVASGPAAVGLFGGGLFGIGRVRAARGGIGARPARNMALPRLPTPKP